LKNTSTIPSVNGDYKSLEKGKNEKHLKNKKKKRVKIESFLIPFFKPP